MRLIALVLIFFLLNACSEKQSTTGALDAGRTAEWTVQKYQHFVDQNQFAKAKQLSTPAEQTRLDQLAAIMVRESLDEAVLTTNFLEINCRENRKEIYCQCIVEDEYERYEMMYKLIWFEGQWLVDAPDGNGGEEEVIDNVLNEMKEVLQ